MNGNPMLLQDRKSEDHWVLFETARCDKGYPALDPQTAADLKKVFYFSSFVSGNLARRPDISRILHTSGDLYRIHGADAYRLR